MRSELLKECSHVDCKICVDGNFAQRVTVFVYIEPHIFSSCLRYPVHLDSLVGWDSQVLTANHEIDGGFDFVDMCDRR